MTTKPAPTDRLAHMTNAQRRAVSTTDRSIIVSAAAGSGKTMVLAQRCAHLVCDLPASRRCGIDELLVVTFTEAAAGEMRTRIGKAIQQRLDDDPDNEYLRRQLFLLDSASISTIHAFCKTLIQRWFPQAGVDPQATVISGAEAELLRHETIEQLFLDLYAGNTPLARGFQSLVDDYGGGNDGGLREIVLKTAEYIGSLPDPDEWLQWAFDFNDAAVDRHQLERLGAELVRQRDDCRQLAAQIRTCWPIAEIHAAAIDEHAERLAGWHESLTANGDWQVIADCVRDFTFERAKARPRNLSEEDKAAYECAKDLRDAMKKRFEQRLKQAICRFTAEEYREALRLITPHLRTLTDLTTSFRDRYQQAKSEQGLIDFNDMQRHAHDLLVDREHGGRPSEIARQLQQRYRHVLVDEFQDVDPLQAAILRCVSREHGDPPTGNLFTVGDIKQSIYRFRLAEPALFSARAEQFASGDEPGELITLQENFRSRDAIIDAINHVFRPLMSRDFGGSDYDERAELRAGMTYPESSSKPVFDRPAVEMHLLENVTEQTRPTNDEEDEESAGNGDASNAALELEGIEREGYLIARKISEWMGDNAGGERKLIADRPARPGEALELRPIEYRDIAILMRAMKHKAERIADVLIRMGIPARVDRPDAGIDSTEFRDCVSLLQLLDNAQQDVPLATVLRAPLMADPLNETQLLHIRLSHRDLPFHAAVLRYAEDGTDRALRDHLAAKLATLKRWRQRIRREPVAEVLWDILQETGYLAYVTGLPDGRRRRGHLVQLHDLARQFGTFARQGLHRFLRFLDEAIDKESDLPASAAESDDNVIRIMSAHASKGLEFPVVIVADAAKRFNQADTQGPVLIDRELGLCLSAADPGRRIYYPTLPRQLAAENAQHESLSEELRILYVALTRAREHLMIIGRTSMKTIDACASLIRQSAPMPPSSLDLATANSPLDWLVSAITAMPRQAVAWRNEPAPHALFRVHGYDRADTDAWRMPPAVQPERIATLENIANLQPLETDEPFVPADALIEPLLATYPGLELTSIPARVTFRDLEKRWDSTYESDEQPVIHTTDTLVSAEPAFTVTSVDGDSGTRRGSATHALLQMIDLARPCDRDDLADQLKSLIAAGRLSPDDEPAVMLDAAAWFFTTAAGRRIRDAADIVLREVPFVGRIPPERHDDDVRPRDRRDVLLVRGVIDLVLPCEQGIEILDYKTDRIGPEDCDARAKTHRGQLAYYASAMADIYRRPVTRCSIVFLDPRRVVELTV